MATLPDLDKSNVGPIAFWNAIDQGGVSDIDPSEATSWSFINSSTLYDNGVQGTVNLDIGGENNGIPGTRTVYGNFRVKEDGWIIVWLDQSENFTQNEQLHSGFNNDIDMPNSMKGWWNLDPRWINGSYRVNPPDAVDSSFNYQVNGLRQELSNSGSMTFSKSDIGLYHFGYEASVLTVLGTSANFTDTYRFSYSNSTDFKAVVAAGSSQARSGDSSDLEFQGDSTVALSLIGSSPEEARAGVYDLKANNAIPNSGTNYGHDGTVTNENNTANQYTGGVYALFD